MLESEGLIERRNGSGVFVSGGVILGDRVRRIVDVLRDEIQRGKLAPGARLPLMEDIRARFGGPCNITILSAHDHLEAEGLIVRRRGVGIFVAGSEPVQAAFQRIRDAVREEISNGTYKPGDLLPSRQLMSRFGVSWGPLLAAFRELRAEGLVETTRARGTFVAGGPPHQSKAVTVVDDEIRRQISDGTLKPGDKLPSEAALAREHDISASRMRKALDGLKAEGVLIGRQGSGTYVAAPRAAVRD